MLTETYVSDLRRAQLQIDLEVQDYYNKGDHNGAATSIRVSSGIQELIMRVKTSVENSSQT